MSAVTWLALSGWAGLGALPGPAAGRVAGLTDDGRLRRPGVPQGGPRWGGARVAGPGTAVAALLLTASVAVSGGALLAVAAAAVLGLAVLVAHDVRRGRRGAMRHRELLTGVRVLAGELSAGARPADALAAAAGTGATTRELLGPAARSAAVGQDTAGALLSDGVPELRALGAAWRVADTTGAGLAAVVDRVADDLAARATVRRAVATSLAGPRASAVLVGGLPLIGIVLGAAMGAAPLDFLFTDPAGRAVCCGGVLLDVAGALWTRAIVRRAEGP